jgi:hypothetical protein
MIIPILTMMAGTTGIAQSSHGAKPLDCETETAIFKIFEMISPCDVLSKKGVVNESSVRELAERDKLPSETAKVMLEAERRAHLVPNRDMKVYPAWSKDLADVARQTLDANHGLDAARLWFIANHDDSNAEGGLIGALSDSSDGSDFALRFLAAKDLKDEQSSWKETLCEYVLAHSPEHFPEVFRPQSYYFYLPSLVTILNLAIEQPDKLSGEKVADLIGRVASLGPYYGAYDLVADAFSRMRPSQRQAVLLDQGGTSKATKEGHDGRLMVAISLLDSIW